MSAFIVSANHYATARECVLNLAKKQSSGTDASQRIYLNGLDLHKKNYPRVDEYRYGHTELYKFSEDRINEYFAILAELNVVSYVYKYGDVETGEVDGLPRHKAIETYLDVILEYDGEPKQLPMQDIQLGKSDSNIKNRLLYLAKLAELRMLLLCIQYQIETDQLPELTTKKQDLALEFLAGLVKGIEERFTSYHPFTVDAQWSID